MTATQLWSAILRRFRKIPGECRQATCRKRYTLDELLAQCDSSAPLTDEDRAWLDFPSVGREL
jgi:hypothetical protein